MEVDRISFQHHLLGVLIAISESHFVSVDLEFSGIPTRPSNSRDKQTLEERYKETKAAAEKFQILQFGITCVQQDYHNEIYTARPYNFNISPLLDDQWGVERIFAFQSGACQFLLSHGFRMDLPFTDGVGYLSRDEAKLAKKLAYARLDKKDITDIVLKDHENQSIAFVRNVRDAIMEWKKREMRGHLHITSNIGQNVESEQPATISNFEKRLVHQLVRTEFPELKTFSKPDYIQIVPLDEDRESSWRTQRKKKIKEQIDTETGFRWVVEALVGGDLSRLDPLSFARNAAGESEFVDLRGIKDRFFRAREALRRRPRVLVGHNLFIDLMYLYRTFIGALPDTVDEFQKTIHKLFPLIIDTKYMATHHYCGISPSSSLEQTEEKLRLQRTPIIRIHENHNKYVKGTDSFHEAGYDSLLTANIMTRLSAKLESEGGYIEQSTLPEDDTSYETAPEDNGGISLGADGGTGPEEPPDTFRDVSRETVKGPSRPAKSTYRVSSPLIPSSVGPQWSSARTRKGKKVAPVKDKAGSRFAMPTKFDQLSIEEAIEWESDESSTQTQLRGGASAWPRPSWDVDDGVKHNEGPYPLPKIEKKAPMAVMPPFDSDFWRVYGNKLRVFGTEEEVLELKG